MTAYYNEKDPKAAAWLRELIKAKAIADGEVDERSIEDVEPRDLHGFVQCHFFAGIGVWSYALRRAGWPDSRAVWTGSCPCQPFSAAGKGAGFDDERHLWPHWFHLIALCGPDKIFGEQVASKDGLSWLDLVSADLEAAQYALGAVDTCAAGFGAPHIRQRLYFVAESTIERRKGQRLHLQPGQAPLNQSEAGWRGEARELANSDGRHTSSEREQRSGEQRQLSQDGCVDELGDTGRSRFSLGSIATDERRALRFEGSAAGETEPVRGFWRGADWIYCTDGKYRPVEPGSFPLAHGAPARVGRLRGYGNALVADQAQAFIEAFMSM